VTALQQTAAALVRAKEPLEVITRPLLPPGEGEVPLQLEACALGLSDWDVAMRDGLPRTPLIPGAEAVGRVVAVGPGVSVAMGARLAVTPLASTCDACPLCERGLAQYCPKVEVHGFARDGALASHGHFRAQHLVPVSDAVDARQVCAVLSAGWGALGGLQTGGVGAGQTIGVWGIGGVGALVVQLAKRRGARVVAVEPEADRRTLALSLGAEQALPPAEAGALRRSLHAALMCTPSTQALAQAHHALQAAGTLVLLGGGPATRIDLPLFETVARGIAVKGSFLGSRSELLEVRDLVEAGALTSPVVHVPLAEAPARLYALRDLGFVGRLVFDTAA
jgi:propanol-preferring alcohol dehydrogenase